MTEPQHSETTGFKITGGSKYPFIDPDKLTWKTEPQFTLHVRPAPSGWKCYLFGNTPSGVGFVYTPTIGQVPNWFVRWMMKVCFACTWVNTQEKS